MKIISTELVHYNFFQIDDDIEQLKLSSNKLAHQLVKSQFITHKVVNLNPTAALLIVDL